MSPSLIKTWMTGVKLRVVSSSGRQVQTPAALDQRPRDVYRLTVL